MTFNVIDAGKALDFYIRSHYASLSNFSRMLLDERKEKLSPLFSGDEILTANKIRAKLEWLKRKRNLDDSELFQLKEVYGVDTDEMFQSYARAKGISITGDNNVTNSQDTSINIGDPTLSIENTFLRKENEQLKGQIEQLNKVIDLLEKSMNQNLTE